MVSENLTPAPRGTTTTKSIGAIISVIIGFLTIWNTLDGRIQDLRAEYKADAAAHKIEHSILRGDLEALEVKVVELEKYQQEFNVVKNDIKDIKLHLREDREERITIEADVKELFKATAKIDGTLTAQGNKDK